MGYIPLTVDSFVERILMIKPHWKKAWIFYHAKNPHYSTFEMAKNPVKNILIDGEDPPEQKAREISAPCPALKSIQEYILRMILDPACGSLLPCAHGCVPGHSVVTNAWPHVGALWKIHMDVSNFFPTISPKRVYGLFRRLFKYDTRLSWLLTRLVTWNDSVPQGAPTSPAIANHIASGMDRNLVGLANAMGAYYTRYVDDFTFSFRWPMRDENKERFQQTVSEIVERHGFKINQTKTSIVSRASRMVVTGVVVNTKPSVARWYRSRVRAALHQHRLEYPTADRPNIIRGRLAYINMVNPVQADSLMRAHNKHKT
jgi:hypothetical protein